MNKRPLSEYPARPLTWGVALYGTSQSSGDIDGFHFMASSWPEIWSYLCVVGGLSEETCLAGHQRNVELSAGEREALLAGIESEHAATYEVAFEDAQSSLSKVICRSCISGGTVAKESCSSCDGSGWRKHPMRSRHFSASAVMRFKSWLQVYSEIHTLSDAEEELRVSFSSS